MSNETYSDMVGTIVTHDGVQKRIAAYMLWGGKEVFRLVELERSPPYQNWEQVECTDVEIPEIPEASHIGNGADS